MKNKKITLYSWFWFWSGLAKYESYRPLFRAQCQCSTVSHDENVYLLVRLGRSCYTLSGALHRRVLCRCFANFTKYKKAESQISTISSTTLAMTPPSDVMWLVYIPFNYLLLQINDSIAHFFLNRAHPFALLRKVRKSLHQTQRTNAGKGIGQESFLLEFQTTMFANSLARFSASLPLSNWVCFS